MNNFLTIEQIEILKEGHHASRNKKHADRIKTILFLNYGFTYQEIAKLLLLDDSTIRRYYNEYVKGGLEVLIEDNYQGGTSKLCVGQQSELKEFLKTNTMQTSKEIVAYVKATYNIDYTVEGMTALLHNLGFVYKKAKQLPGKADKEKQEEFINRYEKLKADKNKEDKIYFMDGCHPHHNSIPAFGWIMKGSEKHLKANTGRMRINLNGAYNIEDKDVIIREDERISSESTIALFEQLTARQKLGIIYIIADNAKYYKSEKVNQYLKNHKRIQLLFLPPYSPNLNVIERLWLLFKKKILYNKYYEDFKTFKKMCMEFFENIQKYANELESLMTDNFHIIVPKFSQT